MKSRDFAFWLQGFFELTEPDTYPKGLTPYQVRMIKEHLGLVFQHDPDIAAKPHPAPSPGGSVAGGLLGGAIMIC